MRNAPTDHHKRRDARTPWKNNSAIYEYVHTYMFKVAINKHKVRRRQIEKPKRIVQRQYVEQRLSFVIKVHRGPQLSTEKLSTRHTKVKSSVRSNSGIKKRVNAFTDKPVAANKNKQSNGVNVQHPLLEDMRSSGGEETNACRKRLLATIFMCKSN